MTATVSAWKIKQFSRLVSYCEQGQSYQFVFDGSSWRLEPIASPKLIQIFARGDYQETMERLPVVDKSALSGILKLRRQQESARKVWLLRHKDETASYLNVWTFPEQHNTSFITLPESLLLSKLVQPADVMVVKDEYYLAAQHKVIYSAKRFALLPDAERFASMVGVPFEQTQHVNLSNWANLLCNAFWQMSLNELVPFFRPSIDQHDKAALKTSGLVCAGVVVSYLAISSGWLLFQKHSLQSAIEQNRAQINLSLTQFERLSELNELVGQRDAVFNANQFESEFFALIESLRKVAKIERLQTNNQRFIVRGKTQSALNVLEAISMMDSTKDARFDEPVRSYQGQEEFVISFEMVQPVKATLAKSNEENHGAA